MAKSARTYHRSLIVLAAFALTGCFGTVPRQPPSTPPIQARNQTEIDVTAIKDGWLIECEGLKGPMPKNTHGDLLLDYTNVISAAASCISRQRSLVRYLKPIVDREKAKVTPDEK